MKKNNFGNQAPTEYTLTQEDLKQIEDNAKKLIDFVEEYMVLYHDWAQVKWFIGFDNINWFCKYHEFIWLNIERELGVLGSLELTMDMVNQSAALSLTIERVNINLEEIMEVSKIMFRIARSIGCNFIGAEIDIVLDDDPRRDYEFK